MYGLNEVLAIFLLGCITGCTGERIWQSYKRRIKPKEQEPNLMSDIERRGKEIERMYDELKRM